MSSSFARLQEVLKDLLAFHPTIRLSGGHDSFAQLFCQMLQRQRTIHSIKAHFDGDDAVFMIHAGCRDSAFKLYDSFNYGLRTFLLTTDAGVNPDQCLVMYRLRRVRSTCSNSGPAANALTFGLELA